MLLVCLLTTWALFWVDNCMLVFDLCYIGDFRVVL